MAWNPEILATRATWMRALARQLVGDAGAGLAREPVGPAPRGRREEVERVLAEELGRVEEPFRSALMLRFVERMSVRAIARRLALPEDAVAVQLAHGLERLRARLARRLGPDAWTSALMPIAGSGRPWPWGKVLVGLAFVTVVFGVWAALPPSANDALGGALRPDPRHADAIGPPTTAEATLQAPSEVRVDEPGPTPRAERAAVRSAAPLQPPGPPGAAMALRIEVRTPPPERQPVAGAEVWLALRWPDDERVEIERLGTTDVAGVLVCAPAALADISPAAWDHADLTLHAEHPELGLGSERYGPDSNLPTRAEVERITVSPRFRKFRIATEDGTPVVGARVRITGATTAGPPPPGTPAPNRTTLVETVSGADGWFAVSTRHVQPAEEGGLQGLRWADVWGGLTLRAHHMGRTVEQRLAGFVPSTGLDPLVVLPALGGLRGRVRLPDGSPAAGLAVEVVSVHEHPSDTTYPRSGVWQSSWSGRTEEDGTFEAPDMPRGLYGVFLAGDEEPRCTALLPGGEVDLLWDAPLLRVQSVDFENRPVRGFKVRLVTEGDGYEQAFTRGPLAFATFPLEADEQVRLEYTTGPEQRRVSLPIEVPEEARTVTVRVPADDRLVGTLSVHVRGLASELEGPISLAIGEAYSGAPPYFTFDDVGRAGRRLGPLPPGLLAMHFQLAPEDRLRGLGLLDSMPIVDFEENPRAELRLEVVRGAPVEITFTHESQAAAPEATSEPASTTNLPGALNLRRLQVEARSAHHAPVALHPRIALPGSRPYAEDWWLPSASETSVEVLPAGRWTLHVDGPNWRPVEVEVDVTAGRTARLTVPISLL